MTISQTRNIGCLVVNISCGKLAKSLMQDLDRHIHNCGTEWTCARQKAVYTAALNLADGKPEIAQQIYQQNSIAYTRHNMLPKGPWGVVVRRFLEADRPSVNRRAAAALRIYTTLALKQGRGLTERQMRKALPAITGPARCVFSEKPVSFASDSDWIPQGWFDPHWTKRPLFMERPYPDPLTVSDAKKLVHKFHEITDKLTPDGVIHYACEVLKLRMEVFNYSAKPVTDRERDASGLRAMSYYYSPVTLPPNGKLRAFPYGSMTNSLNTTEWVPKSLDYETPCFEMREELRAKGLKDQVAGRIFCIQEQGCKARVVAQPQAWLQLSCLPYHKKLSEANNFLFAKECDVSHQEAGAYAAISNFNAGKPVISVDLSSATDRFPRRLTCELIRTLGYPEFAEAMDQISASEWDFPYGGDGCTVKYSVGQPMGLYGSFPAFTLSNLCLCELSVRLAESTRLLQKLKAYNELDITDPKSLDAFNEADNHTLVLEPFAGRTEYYHVIGDDVIFSDHRVADAYKVLLKTLGVEVSPEKCYSNGRIAEYAGFIIRKTLHGHVCAFRPYKIPSQPFITNPLEFIHALGAHVKKIPSRKGFWTKVFYAYQNTLDLRDISLAPLVPADEARGWMSNRASARDIVQLSRRIGYEQSEYLGPEKVDTLYPCLSGETKINRKPLFIEAGPTDHWGFDPKTYSPKRDDRPKDFHTSSYRMQSDPLIQLELVRLTAAKQLLMQEQVNDPVETNQTEPTHSWKVLDEHGSMKNFLLRQAKEIKDSYDSAQHSQTRPFRHRR